MPLRDVISEVVCEAERKPPPKPIPVAGRRVAPGIIDGLESGLHRLRRLGGRLDGVLSKPHGLLHHPEGMLGELHEYLRRVGRARRVCPGSSRVQRLGELGEIVGELFEDQRQLGPLPRQELCRMLCLKAPHPLIQGFLSFVEPRILHAWHLPG